MLDKVNLKIQFSLLVLFLTSSLQPSEGLRILGLFPLNGKSHYVICDRLMKGLAKKGHQVDVYGHFPPKDPIPNFKYYSLEGSLPDLKNNVTFDDTMQFRARNIRKAMNTVGTNLCKLMDMSVFQSLLKNPPKNPPYDLVILEGFMSNCYLAWGRHLKIPMIGFSSNQLMNWQHESLGNPLNTAVMTAIGWKDFDHTNFWSRLANTVMSKYLTALFKYYMYEQDEYVEKYFGPGYPDIIELQKDIDLMLVNTDLSLNGPAAYTPAVVPIGGLHIKDDDSNLDEDVQEWLDDSKNGCMYVSFGSMLRLETFPKEIVKAFYNSFEKIAPVRVLMKIAKPEDLIPGLPKNVMTKSWLSQELVLKHKNTKAFVTHGGLMSSLESIYYGVPMIGIPIFADQNINVERNVKREIAKMVKLEEITEEKLTQAFKDVLFDPKYKKNIEQLSRRFKDRPMKPLDEAIFWIEYVARHGKGCLRSPLIDLQWWQANLLDVYGFILLVLLTLLYLLKKIFKLIFKFCINDKNKNNKPSKKKQQ